MIYDLFVQKDVSIVNHRSDKWQQQTTAQITLYNGGNWQNYVSKRYYSVSITYLYTWYWQNKNLMCFTYYDTFSISIKGHRGRDLMVVGFTTTYAISAYHHWFCESESQPGWGVQHYVIKFVSDFRRVGGFLRVFRFPPPIKLSAMI